MIFRSNSDKTLLIKLKSIYSDKLETLNNPTSPLLKRNAVVSKKFSLQRKFSKPYFC